MKEIFESFETAFWKFWNLLYAYLCELLGGEVNPDWLAPLPKE